MALNQKVEQNRPQLEFNFTYWEVFSALYTACKEPDYNLYKSCIQPLWLTIVQKLNNKQVHNPILQSTKRLGNPSK